MQHKEELPPITPEGMLEALNRSHKRYNEAPSRDAQNAAACAFCNCELWFRDRHIAIVFNEKIQEWTFKHPPAKKTE